MKIKRLEIQGFKSFKDKMVVHFDQTITGIVGPNGCGKSNIVDAFFWVMGEQSIKHMRGSSSDDLIFNGSSKYAPGGIAEATLVMEQDVAVDPSELPAGASISDSPILKKREISVTRRLYRGGEGEYLINGIPSRLKDIHELFMDTGVGTKGYSIIEQGAIGKIVNSKPEDRRLLVEEAAGIAKYKARKKESLRKLESAQGNMGRLADVIQEIERNLSSLERQAQKAKQYKKFKDELFDKEITWGRRKVQVLKQKLEEFKKKAEILEHELLLLKTELHTAETTVETDRLNQLTFSKQAEELQARLQDLSTDLTQSRSDLDLSRQRQSDLASQLNSLSLERGEIIGNLESDRAQVTSQEQEVSEYQQVLDAALNRVMELDDQVRSHRQMTESARRELEERRQRLMRGISESSGLMSRSAGLEVRVQSIRERLERIEVQLQEYTAKSAVLRAEVDEAQEVLTTHVTKKEELLTEKQNLKASVAQLDADTRDLTSRSEQSTKQATQLRSRLHSLEELDAMNEGFGNGPKSVLDWARNQGKGDHLRAMADALEITSGYEAVVEAWFESRLEDLITDDVGLAIQALQDLAAQKQGRAAIYVAGGEAMGVSGRLVEKRQDFESLGFIVVGELKDYVQFSARANDSARLAIEKNLLQVCVVQEIQSSHLNALASQGFDRLGGWSIVSMDGMVIGSNGLLRGGSLTCDEAGSVLGRKRAIAELRDSVTSAESQAQELKTALTDVRERFEASKTRLSQVQGDLQAIEVEVNSAQWKLNQKRRSFEEVESSCQEQLAEKNEDTTSLTQVLAERESIEAKIVEIQKEREDLEARIAQEDSQLGEKTQELQALDQDLQQARIQEASMRERGNSLRRELESARVRISEKDRRLQEIDRILTRMTEEKDNFSGKDSGLEQRIGDLTAIISQTRETLSEVKDQADRASTKVNEALERIKTLHRDGDEKTAASTHAALESERLSGDLNHLMLNLEEKYGPGCLERPISSPIQEEMTEPVVTAEMTAEEEQKLFEEVESLKERIRRLGEVNVMAIEEFDELSKRYEHLTAEKSDLEKSIENLNDAIEHINKTSEERFRKAYEAINERFKKLFPIIFGGGSAELSLLYPEGSQDILESGVEIIASPPGKKVSNITLLSGGEKALTALSLIFAIFMIKPSPFCILDEVDAPLDDANVGKFNALLKEMSARSQFIIVTHNKKTMELNDTLYGVTMEEPGVSKMVSIRIQ